MSEAAVALGVLQAIAAAASIIASVDSIMDDPAKRDEFRDLIATLRFRRILLATQEILEALNGVRRAIDEDVALDSITDADTAFFSDLLVQNDQDGAEDRSFSAAHRLFLEKDVVFASAFMHVVNIRLVVLRAYRAGDLARFDDEVRSYIDHLNAWTAQVNTTIEDLHTIRSEEITRGTREYWRAIHYRDGEVVHRFEKLVEGSPRDEREEVERRARGSRSNGINADKHDFSAYIMRDTARDWERSWPF